MAENTSPKYTPKQIEKYKRQKCISLLEKITKNCFKMLRDQNSTKSQIIKKFNFLKKKIDELGTVHLDTNYNKAMKKYVDNFDVLLKNTSDINNIREKQMTALNRLQKLKNETSYKREKHRKKITR